MYDAAAVRLKGPGAATNFPYTASAKTVVPCDSFAAVSGDSFAAVSGDGFASPTSVLAYDDGGGCETMPFEGLRYGDVDGLEFGFAFDIDVPSSLTDVNSVLLSQQQRFGKEEFGEFDPDEFLTWPA